jgi:hypothetical protein
MVLTTVMWKSACVWNFDCSRVHRCGLSGGPAWHMDRDDHVNVSPIVLISHLTASSNCKSKLCRLVYVGTMCSEVTQAVISMVFLKSQPIYN